jgi:hypothetical protein
MLEPSQPTLKVKTKLHKSIYELQKKTLMQFESSKFIAKLSTHKANEHNELVDHI